MVWEDNASKIHEHCGYAWKEHNADHKCPPFPEQPSIRKSVRYLYIVGLCDWNGVWDWCKAYNTYKEANAHIDRAIENDRHIETGDVVMVEYDG